MFADGDSGLANCFFFVRFCGKRYTCMITEAVFIHAGSISSQATDKSLRRIILEVADNVKEASSPMVEPPQAIDLQGLQEQHL